MAEDPAEKTTQPEQPAPFNFHEFLARAAKAGKLADPFDGELRDALAQFTASISVVLSAALGPGDPQRPSADATPARRFEEACLILGGILQATAFVN